MITASGSRLSQEIARQSRLTQDIARTQTNISTGKRMIAPSDDPGAAMRVAQIGQAQSNDASWASNLQLANALATQADSVLASLAERMTHANGLMVAASTGTMSAADRATHAAELRAIASEVADFAATKTSLGTALFAGGDAPSMRVEASIVLTPVAPASDVFSIGGTALSTILNDAATALESGNAAQIGTALATVGGAVDHVADAAAAQGVRAARIDTLTERNLARGVELASERSLLEDTDLSSAIARLNAQQITLDAAQAAFARINRRTLFDLIG